MAEPHQVQPRTEPAPSPTKRSSSKASSVVSRRSSRHGSVGDPTVVKELSKKYESPFDASLAAARKRSQQEKLWEMFATYALQLSCEDPTRMRLANVIKMLQDCGVIDGSSTEEAKLIEKEVLIVCGAFMKSHPNDRDGTKKLSFSAFLALLNHFARMSGDQDATRAYDSLVRTCLEKQPKPRVRVAIAKDLQECKKVLQQFEEPLSKMFLYYAGISLAKLEKIDPKMAQLSPPHMGYAECVTFGRKYGIIAHGVMTTTEFATIYIDSLVKAPADEYGRVLSYEGFTEMLVRVARKVSPVEHIPPEKKLKGLFQLMWLASASSSPRDLKITDVLKTDRINVTKLFLIHFEKHWKKDQYQNYVGSRVSGDEDTDSGDSFTRLQSSGDLGSSPPPSPKSKSTRRLSLCVQSPGKPKEDLKPAVSGRRFTMQT
ncbi:TPA: hypothetical protein N0F65_012038 [Lagenidium giganteum]|uniref:Uncharacterized protein n=1 Tax=Lagenidium giganteum TaxID=4803 RepID=A0AAV2YPQ1_9STRA|nr:TPA: hypothetical protein N0F65_012038 [Lagenidium giganteum]